MSERPNYWWIVTCKNHLFHQQREYPFAPTDAFAPLPTIDDQFLVRCDEWGKTYTYRPSEVWRSEQELPHTFKLHRLFQDSS